ncbi:Peptidase S26 [Dillenia turbinata]|uniref:Peptidase S26 n=1 Tax=Dillenia turbinata TaxID=194707 RepID=A0AAN8UKK4_9MAGN
MSFWNSVPWTSIIKDAATNAFGVAKFLCLIHVTNQYVVSPVLAVGPSMVPTIDLTGNLVFVERLSTRFGKLAPGDIVIVRDPQNPRQILTKRLTALEGDTVTYSVDPDHPEKSETVIV